MPFDTTILIYALLALSVILIVWIIRMEIRVRRLLRGKNAGSLEDTILSLQNELDDYRQFKNHCGNQLSNVERRLGRSIASVKTLRYNPFKGSGGGGNQSFSTAFVDEQGNGVVLTCLHSRDRVSVFSKPVERLVSPNELSEEETQELKEAHGRIRV